MARTTGNRYVPNYLVTPGAVLQDYLESLGMTQAELAERTGLTKKTINEIAKGKAPITPETAMRFERPLGRPAHFWNNLELQYQEDIVRLEEEKRRQANLDWLADKPVNELVKRGWIPAANDKASLIGHVLRFFGIASCDEWPSLLSHYRAA